MDIKSFLTSFWSDVTAQNADKLKLYFTDNAYIRWNNTNEQFTADEFIKVNCEYPGDWYGKIERIEIFGSQAVTATHIWLADSSASYHVVSFLSWMAIKLRLLMNTGEMTAYLLNGDRICILVNLLQIKLFKSAVFSLA